MRKEAPRSNLASRLRQAIVVYFCLVFVAMIWPVYPLFSSIEPWLFGLPFSLTYLIALLLVSFFVLLSFFLWESRNGEID